MTVFYGVGLLVPLFEQAAKKTIVNTTITVCNKAGRFMIM
jgi:hypothetical protein